MIITAMSCAAVNSFAQSQGLGSEVDLRPSESGRHVVEAELHLIWGEHQGRAPMVFISPNLEFGVGRFIGLVVGGVIGVVGPQALLYLEDTETGGGLNTAVRFYLRGSRPRAFALGAAFSLLVVGGSAIAAPRAELMYRFVLFSHLSLRLHASVGGHFLWDTAICDDRPGPLTEDADLLEEACDPSFSGQLPKSNQNGIWIGVGLALGYSG